MKIFTYPVRGGYRGREGWAAEIEPGLFRDTYSEVDGTELVEWEIEGLHFQFDTDEFDELTGNSDGSAPAIWGTYSSENRGFIPSAAGTVHRWFIRKGANPDMSYEIARQRREVAEAEQALGLAELTIASAQSRLDGARLRLDELEARPH